MKVRATDLGEDKKRGVLSRAVTVAVTRTNTRARKRSQFAKSKYLELSPTVIDLGLTLRRILRVAPHLRRNVD